MSLLPAVRGLLRPLRCVLTPPASPRRGHAAVADARAILESELEGIRVAGTWKGERIITSKQGPRINVDGSRGSE
jgi:glycine C-acetyltransferase